MNLGLMWKEVAKQKPTSKARSVSTYQSYHSQALWSRDGSAWSVYIHEADMEGLAESGMRFRYAVLVAVDVV